MPRRSDAARVRRTAPADAARTGGRWRRAVTVLAVGVLTVLAVGWWSGPSAGPAGAAPAPAGAHHAMPDPLAAGVALADGGPTTETSWGPLTDDDRALLIRVKLAGLWEVPAGEMAQTHSTDQRVKYAGQVMAADHRRLNEEVAVAARKLQVTLPDEPNFNQRGWLAEMSPERGHAFDETFANRLRTAHGQVFAVVADIRANTRNTLIRAFASEATDVVMKHMSLLEATGLVAPVEADTLAPPAPHGPISTQLVVVAVVLVGVANVALAARRSWA
jgi:putative membrane protein